MQHNDAEFDNRSQAGPSAESADRPRLSRTFNIEKEPLRTGETAPSVSWRERAATLFPEWIRHRTLAMLLVVVLLAVVAWLGWTAVRAAVRVFQSRLPAP